MGVSRGEIRSEWLPYKEEVGGSTPSSPTLINPCFTTGVLFLQVCHKLSDIFPDIRKGDTVLGDTTPVSVIYIDPLP